MFRNLLRTVLILILLTVPLALAQEGYVWKTEDAVFSDESIHNAELIRLPDGQYRMFFHQVDQMKSATSADGKTFTIDSGVRLTGGMPSLVQLPDGKWRMYYQSQQDGKGVIKSATSTDTLNWTVEPGTRLSSGGQYDPDSVVHPSVVALPEGGWRMYYDGEIRRTEQEFVWRILSATSADGLNFTKDPGVRVDVAEQGPAGEENGGHLGPDEREPLDPDLVWNAHALYEEGLFRLYFGVQTPSDSWTDGIYSATSNDGLLFSGPIPELTPQEESGRFGPGGQVGSYQDPFVYDFPEGRRMYYWVNGSGYYSALREAAPAEEEGAFGSLVGRIQDWAGNLQLPAFGEIKLYIVPAVLLISAGAAILLFIKFSQRKGR